MNTDQLLKYIGQVMDEIFEGVLLAEDLLKDKNKSRLLGVIFETLDRLGITIEDIIPEEAKNAYFSGFDEAAAQITEIGIAPVGGLALTASGQIASGFRQRVHLEAIDDISSDLLLDLKAAIRTVKANSEISIVKVLEDVRSEISKGMIKGDHNKVVSKRVAQSFEKTGFTAFVTKDGKNLPLDFYARVVTKTKMKEANTNGAVSRYLENSIGLVKVNEHKPTCHVCSRYEGLVISLTGEHEGFKSVKDEDVQLPPYHPHCEHSIRPFVDQFKTDEEMKAERDKWKKWSPEKDTRSAVQKKAYEKEQKIRRKANQEKKAYAKMKAILGDRAPKTIGAYRRMRRQNTIKYQELMSEYRSTLREMRGSK